MIAICKLLGQIMSYVFNYSASLLFIIPVNNSVHDKDMPLLLYY